MNTTILNPTHVNNRITLSDQQTTILPLNENGFTREILRYASIVEFLNHLPNNSASSELRTLSNREVAFFANLDFNEDAVRDNLTGESPSEIDRLFRTCQEIRTLSRWQLPTAAPLSRPTPTNLFMDFESEEDTDLDANPPLYQIPINLFMDFVSEEDTDLDDYIIE